MEQTAYWAKNEGGFGIYVYLNGRPVIQVWREAVAEQVVRALNRSNAVGEIQHALEASLEWLESIAAEEPEDSDNHELRETVALVKRAIEANQ